MSDSVTASCREYVSPFLILSHPGRTLPIALPCGASNERVSLLLYGAAKLRLPVFPKLKTWSFLARPPLGRFDLVPNLPLGTGRIVHNFALRIDEHRCSLLGRIGRPCRLSLSCRAARSSKSAPHLAHVVSRLDTARIRVAILIATATMLFMGRGRARRSQCAKLQSPEVAEASR